jgi:hypothetical protein
MPPDKPDETMYPIEPLARYLRIQLHVPGNPNDGRADIGREALVERIGSSLSAVSRYIETGFDWDHADRFATAIGVHPSTLWPGWWLNCPSDEVAGWFGDDPPIRELGPLRSAA